MIPDTCYTAELRLRVMATSDLHMQMTDYNYVRDVDGPGSSFAKIATLIKAERADALDEHRTCLLFDNGDTFQGTPVADVIAQSRPGAPHPIAGIMRALDYDAAGLGNHDLDYGLDYLSACLSQLHMPVVCSNMKTALLPMLQSGCILDRDIQARDGTLHQLRIGLVSSLPDKTALWSRFHLEDRAVLRPPVPALRDTAAALRAQGADIIIALAHMGIAPFDEGPEAQNQISDVAQLKEIDIVIGGHTHLRFPGPDHAGIDHVDVSAGTVHGTPVVQPGAGGADLGVIDLTLVRSNDAGHAKRWSITTDSVRLAPATQSTSADATVIRLAEPAHAQTQRILSTRVAHLAHPMHSFFALAAPSALPALLAQAKLRAIREAIAGTAYAQLPLLAAASAPLTGGLDGPDNFLFLEAGPLQRRHIAGMNPYANNVWAVKTTGAQIIDWLERSALIFNRLDKDDPDQLLNDPNVPGFRYDALYGLTYAIDPREPARFNVAGRPVQDKQSTQPKHGRIKDLMWQGAPLDPEQVFLVATTDHRAGGGGLYRPFANEAIVVQGSAPMQEAVLRYFENADCDVVRRVKPWRFVPGLNRRAILLTAPQAADHLDDIAYLSPEPCGETETGFLKLRLHL